jgi:hypothetical protein
MQGSVTLQLARDHGRGFFSPRSVTGFLSDVCSAAADEIGKIYLLADENVSFWLNLYSLRSFAYIYFIPHNYQYGGCCYFLSMHIFSAITFIGSSSLQITTQYRDSYFHITSLSSMSTRVSFAFSLYLA